MRILCGVLMACALARASSDVVSRANALYERTEYQSALTLLAKDPSPDFADDLLTGKIHFALGDYKKATDILEKAAELDPRNSECQLWLGRAWGRRAETGSKLMAFSYAGKARQGFEKAVALDPKNSDAKNDLFDYYLNAPGMLGGGLDKAEALAKTVVNERPAEYEFELAQIADKRKDYVAEEQHLRRAIERAPEQPGRLVDLARFLAKRGRFEESDEVFAKAHAASARKPSILFSEASTWIADHRNLPKARQALEEYLKAPLTPDDPPRQDAEKLLKRAGS